MKKTDIKYQGLSQKQMEALPHLVSAQTVESGCKAAGVSKTSYYNWIKDPSFRAQLKFFRKLIYLAAVNAAEFAVKKEAFDIFEGGFLTGWKAIGAHFGVSARTVQRWHSRYDMPVLRTLEGRPTNTPYELSNWLTAYNRIVDERGLNE